MSDSSPDIYGDVIKIVVPLVQVIIVVVGWKFVSKDNDKREARKEIRAILNDIKRIALDIEPVAVRYYQTIREKGQEDETSLKRLFKQLGILSTSATRLNHKIEFSTPLADFRIAVTGHDFETANRLPSKPNDDKLESITAATTTFLDDIERIFADAYSR